VRPLERDNLLYRENIHGQAGWFQWIQSSRDENIHPVQPLFVVATQTIEVGADLSFDALLTEAAPLDSLRQRFGRLDRLGRRGVSPALIVAPSDAVEKNATDFVYGSAVVNTWKRLQEWASTAKKISTIDFGLNQLQPHIDTLTEDLLPPQPELLDLTGGDIEELAQTYHAPTPSPDIAMLLHGAGAASPADVQIIWRADLPRHLHKAATDVLVETVNLVPPSSPETLAVPAGQAGRWLRNIDFDTSALNTGLTDVEGAQPESDSLQPGGRLVLRWHGPDDTRTGLIEPAEVAPGDTIIVPAAWGGCDAYGWNPASTTAVTDVAETAHLQSRYKPVLRIHSQLPWQNLAPDAELRGDGAIAFPQPEAAADKPAWLQSLLEVWKSNHQLQRYPATKNAGGGVIFRSKKRWKRADVERVLSGNMLDTPTEVIGASTNSANTGCEVQLASHLKSVAGRARLLAELTGCPPEAQRILELAGRLHDIGKADPRFQCWLRGGDWLEATINEDNLLAKSSSSGSGGSFQRTRKLAGWPRGYRHEAISVAMIRSNPLSELSDTDMELLIYLVGSHHGYGRPFFPAVTDTSPQNVKCVVDGETYSASSDHGLHRLDSGWIELFKNMNTVHGSWGLAWLETLLRLADHMVSAEEQNAQSAETHEVQA